VMTVNKTKGRLKRSWEPDIDKNDVFI